MQYWKHSKIKIIYKLWQFQLFQKAMLPQPDFQTNATFLVTPAQRPWGKHGGLLVSPLSCSSSNSNVTLSLCIHHFSHSIGWVPIKFQALFWCWEFWDEIKYLLLREDDQGSRDKVIKCINEKWTLKRGVTFFCNLGSGVKKSPISVYSFLSEDFSTLELLKVCFLEQQHQHYLKTC